MTPSASEDEESSSDEDEEEYDDEADSQCDLPRSSTNADDIFEIHKSNMDPSPPGKVPQTPENYSKRN